VLVQEIRQSQIWACVCVQITVHMCWRALRGSCRKNSICVCELVTKSVWVYMGVEENVYELVLYFNLALTIVCTFW